MPRHGERERKQGRERERREEMGFFYIIIASFLCPFPRLFSSPFYLYISRYAHGAGGARPCPSTMGICGRASPGQHHGARMWLSE